MLSGCHTRGEPRDGCRIVAIAGMVEAQAADETNKSKVSWQWMLLFLMALDFGYWVAVNFIRFFEWDLPLGTVGEYAQSVWLMSQGQWLATNTLLRTPILGDAGEFILLLFVPLYRWFGVPLLLLAGSAAVAVSAWPLAGMLRRSGLPPLAILLTVLLYFTAPATIGGEIYSFDPNMLAMAFALFAMDAAERRKWVQYGVFLLLLLSCKDEAALLALGFAPWLWWGKGSRRAAILTLGCSLLWLFTIEDLIIPHFQSASVMSNLATHYENIGGTHGITGIIAYLFTHPFIVFSSIARHRDYLKNTLVSVILLPLFSPLLALPGLLILLANVLADLGPNGILMRALDSEYTLMALPFLYLGFGATLAKCMKRFSIKATSVLLALICAVFLYQTVKYDWPMVRGNLAVADSPQAQRVLTGILLQASPSVAVVTDNRYATEFVNRGNIMVQWDSLRGFLRGLKSGTRIMAVFDPTDMWSSAAQDWSMLSRLALLPHSHLLADRHGVIALEGLAHSLPDNITFVFPPYLTQSIGLSYPNGAYWILPYGTRGTVETHAFSVPSGRFRLTVPLLGAARITARIWENGHAVLGEPFTTGKEAMFIFTNTTAGMVQIELHVWNLKRSPLIIKPLFLTAIGSGALVRV